ncbi:Fic family protein [Candidatus Poriferisocius sp.]|uniref:Fic family protein n=1 Tax=Candidatus Poriferisocius sp. TaxID=3101276 RepID=UPI003B011F4D
MEREREGFWAFNPKPLPRNYRIPQELAAKLDEATGTVHRLGGVGLLLPNPHLLIGPHLRIEAVLSSRIEGTRTEITQLLRAEAGETQPAAEAAEAQEVRNHVVAMEHGIARIRGGFPISIRLFREMHQHLLRGVRGHHRDPGELRRSPVWIGGENLNEAVFVPPPPEKMRQALNDLERFLHEQDLPLLVQLAMAHYQFEVIHPFLDGNGRIGRLLIPLMLLEREVLPQPLLYLSAFFEQHRSQYYDHLLRTSQHGDMAPWIRFFLEGVSRQARDAEKRTIRLVELQQRMRDALLEEGKSGSVLRLVELLFVAPLLSAPMAASRLGVSSPTAYKAIRELEERGDLREVTGRQRHRLYEAPRIFQAVYGPVDAGSETN